METKDQVILVDMFDKEKGYMDKLEAHKKGVLHRAFSIFLFNSKGEILLQRRAKSKYHSGGLWTNTCCSHPRPGEDSIAAANRRLHEEMQIETPLRKAFDFIYRIPFKNGLIEHELDYVFTGSFDGEPTLNEEEADAWKYENPLTVLKGIESNPELYTEWFKIAFNRACQSTQR